jgi:pyruvate/2-oxoglutarate dehydrogenase complex dihydrolipoamide dehydrogenase (E3) component
MVGLCSQQVALEGCQGRTRPTDGVDLGIHSQPPVVDMVQVREYLRSTIRQIYLRTTPEALKQKGLDIFLGAACFVDPHTLNVGSQQITAKKILIATGAEPVLPRFRDSTRSRSQPTARYSRVIDSPIRWW